VHSPIRRGISKRRVAGAAAALIMAGGLATTLMEGTALAGPIIFTTSTSITTTSQTQSNDPVVTINVSVTAGGGNSAPSGSAHVVVVGSWQNCWASLNSSSGLTGSGSCQLSLSPGSYTLQAKYPGANQLSNSASSDYSLTVSRPSRQGATVTTSLACPAAVNAGQSGNCTLTVVNTGPGTAVNVVGEIALPNALRARYCGNWWWNPGCWVHNNNAYWRLGNLRAGRVRYLTVHFTATGNRYTHYSRLVNVYGSATWGVNFGYGPLQHISVSRYRVEIRPFGFFY
jgi:hypothetical protein